MMRSLIIGIIAMLMMIFGTVVPVDAHTDPCSGKNSIKYMNFCRQPIKTKEPEPQPDKTKEIIITGAVLGILAIAVWQKFNNQDDKSEEAFNWNTQPSPGMDGLEFRIGFDF